MLYSIAYLMEWVHQINDENIDYLRKFVHYLSH